MSDTSAPPPPNNSAGSTSPPSAAPPPYTPPPDYMGDLRVMTLIAYGLYLAAFVTGPITPVIGVVLAYVKRDDAHGTVYESHLSQLINLFWISIVTIAASCLLAITLIGIPLAIVAWCILIVFYLIRTVSGMVKAIEGQPYTDFMARRPRPGPA